MKDRAGIYFALWKAGGTLADAQVYTRYGSKSAGAAMACTSDDLLRFGCLDVFVQVCAAGCCFRAGEVP